MYVALWGGISFLRRRRLGIILQDLPGRQMPRRLLPRHLLLEWRESIAAEPTTAESVAARLPPWRSAEIKELGRGWSDDADQKRGRNRQHDQGAAFGEYAKKRLRI